MTGMILKDIYYVKANKRLYLGLCLFYIIFGIITKAPEMASFFVFYMSIILPMSIMAVDEKSGWERFALTAPISRRDMVLSRYISMGSIGIAINLINFIVQIFVAKGQTIREAVYGNLAILGVCLCFIAVLIPVFLKFGVEKGRIIFFAAVMLLTLTVIIGNKFNLPLEDFINWLKEYVILAPAALLVLVAVSIWSSIRIYNKKEF